MPGPVLSQCPRTCRQTGCQMASCFHQSSLNRGHLEFPEVRRRVLSPNPDHTPSLGPKAVCLSSLLSRGPWESKPLCQQLL